MTSIKSGDAGSTRLVVCWALGGLWLLTYLASLLGGFAVGAAMVAPLILLVLAIVHCSILYGWRGVVFYLAIAIGAGFVFEASSIDFGFPFGHYIHTSVGPKILGVTVPAIFIYAVYAWYAWIIGRAIMLTRPARLTGAGRFVVPIVAAIILAGFDYPFDPIGSTLHGRWAFVEPGGQFGVPLSNYLGWVFVGWVIFQPLGFAESRFRAMEASKARRYWLLPCLIWIAIAIQYPIYWASAPSGTTALGHNIFVIADIYEASLAGSLFTLVFAGLVGAARLFLDEGVHQYANRVNA
ncbi:carotenoid biosynthesis protein [Sphingobium sp.]|uniref:carotenoid biosynthesis protein n=1 Tax=Sphingobium sp. TaxID=1912891 RepID=UPI0028BDF814|nr:carotenoid biosynthesis protein [Sphingobium sp.]